MLALLLASQQALHTSGERDGVAIRALMLKQSTRVPLTGHGTAAILNMTCCLVDPLKGGRPWQPDWGRVGAAHQRLPGVAVEQQPRRNGLLVPAHPPRTRSSRTPAKEQPPA